MNRLGSGSDWLTRCCCFEKSLVECSAQWKKKKKINLGLSLVQGSQIIEVLFAVVHTRADTQLWIQLEGLVFRVVPPPIPHPRPPAFPAKPAFTSVSPLSPRGGGGRAMLGGAPAQQRLPGSGAHRQGGVSTLRRERVDFCPVRSRPALHLGTSTPSPLASGAFPKHPEKSHPSLPRPFSLSPAFFLSAAVTSH